MKRPLPVPGRLATKREEHALAHAVATGTIQRMDVVLERLRAFLVADGDAPAAIRLHANWSRVRPAALAAAQRRYEAAVGAGAAKDRNQGT